MPNTKIIALQEKAAELLDKQTAIMELAEKKDDKGLERGFQGTEEADFDALTKERKGIMAQIERENKLEEVRQAKILSDSRQAPAVHRKDDEKNTYSHIRAARAAISRNWNAAGLEREMHQDWSRGQNIAWNENIMYIDPNQQRAVSVVGTNADGGHMVGTEHRMDKMIDALWNASILSKLPVVNNTGMVGFQSIPVKTSKATATMVGETDALPTAEKVAMTLLTATPKQMVTKSSFSRQLAIQSDHIIENIIRKEVFMTIADKLDSLFISGSTSAPSIGGLLNISGTSLITVNTSGVALTYLRLVTMLTELAKNNVEGDLRFITNAQVKGTALTTLRDTANTGSGYILTDRSEGLLGLPTVISQHVPFNLQTSTTRSAIILGKFDETEVFQWDKIAVEFDPYGDNADASQVAVRSYSFWDIINKRASNFCLIKDCITI